MTRLISQGDGSIRLEIHPTQDRVYRKVEGRIEVGQGDAKPLGFNPSVKEPLFSTNCDAWKPRQ